MEKCVGIQVRAADRIQCDVELTHESENVDEQAHIRAPDAESGFEGKLVDGMTVGSPVSWLVDEEWGEKGQSCRLPGSAEADMSQSNETINEKNSKT